MLSSGHCIVLGWGCIVRGVGGGRCVSNFKRCFHIPSIIGLVLHQPFGTDGIPNRSSRSVMNIFILGRRIPVVKSGQCLWGKKCSLSKLVVMTTTIACFARQTVWMGILVIFLFVCWCVFFPWSDQIWHVSRNHRYVNHALVSFIHCATIMPISSK